jgi:ParB family chromosome partitioning protein
MPKKKKQVAKPAALPKKMKKLALGRGLDALFSDIDTLDNRPAEYFQCDIELISPNPYQPRTHFPEEDLKSLGDSIAAQGILQPLVVRKADIGYELIAGERRLRASKRVGLRQVPVLVRDVSDTELLELSIIENIQREGLNPVEEADAYHRLMLEFGLTQDRVAERVGKSRSAVANFLRLRQLPDEIKENLGQGRLSMGHARALLGVPTPAQQLAVCRKVLVGKLSVRETEALVKRLQQGKKKAPRSAPKGDDAVYFSSLAQDLSRIYGTKVAIHRKGRRGRVEIDFFSDDDLDRLLNLLQRN